jgi:MFS family permease
VGYFRVLRYWRFTCLWSGLTLSSVGDSVTRLALLWLAYHLRGSAVDVGLLVTAYSAPIIVGGPLAGIMLDRIGPRNAMLTDNVVRGILVGLIPVLFHFGVLRPWHL